MSLSNNNNSESTSVDKAKGTVAGLASSVAGVNKTDGSSPLGLIGRNAKREIPGFTPNEAYGTNAITDSWFGALLEVHPDFTGKGSYNYIHNSKPNFKDLSSSERFDRSKSFPNFKDNLPDGDQYFSTRDYYLLFNDTSTDYFKHGLQVIDSNALLRSEKNARETWDGHEEGTPARLQQFTTTPYENTDPILFGFEVVIDAVSSPLLNGAVEDFINQFSNISEVAARKYVINDFKQQFSKLFKTNGKITIDPTMPANQPTMSIPTSNYSNAETQANIYERGRKAYMSYYLKKIGGLELLLESNQPTKKKYLVDYRNDVLKLTFSEDVSSSMGTLAHLYKLLYWSKANGKNIVPENLLRFNCDIIISEVRNLNRVRKAIDTNNLEVIKDNVSRQVYSLRECQFYFDQPAHDNEIDMSQPTKEFDQFVVTMDYKFVSNKFERWVPMTDGANRFGRYVGYNNGAMWKVGNPGGRVDGVNANAGTINDNSVNKFYTTGINAQKQNGVNAPIVLQEYAFVSGGKDGDTIKATNVSNETATNTGAVSNKGDESDGPNETSSKADKAGQRKAAAKSTLDKFKENSKKAGQKLAQNLEKAVIKELKGQVNQRLRLLNNTLDKLRSDSVVSRMKDPTNVYKNYQNDLGLSNGIFFDVRNSLRDFAGEAVGGNLGGIISGGNGTLF